MADDISMPKPIFCQARRCKSRHTITVRAEDQLNGDPAQPQVEVKLCYPHADRLVRRWKTATDAMLYGGKF